MKAGADEAGADEARADDALRSAPPGVLFADRKAIRLKERVKYCREMICGQAPEPSAIEDCLDEIEGLVRELSPAWTPDPSRDVFDETVRAAWQLHSRFIKAKPEAAQEGFDKRLGALVGEAEDAYAKQHLASWKQTFQGLKSAMADMHKQLPGGSDELPTPSQIKAMCRMELGKLEEWARENGCLDSRKQEFNELLESLMVIRTDEPNSFDELIRWYQTKLQHFRNMLQAPQSTGLLFRKG